MQSEGRCYVHNFELAEIRCRNCGYEFCSECLVYAFGANKPPYCVACALAAAGVRSSAARQPTLSRREIKKMEKERRKAEKERLAKPGPRVDAVIHETVAAAPVAPAAPAAPVTPAPPVATPVTPEQAWPTPPPPSDDPFAWADDPHGGQRVPY